MRRIAVISSLVTALGLAGAGAVATGLVNPDQARALLSPAPELRTAVRSEAPADTPQPARVTTVEFLPLSPTTTYAGTVQPRWEASTGFRVAGKVLTRYVEVGDRVEQGDVLARLDPTDLNLAQGAAHAEVDAAREEFARAEAEASRSQALLAVGLVPQAASGAALASAAEARGRLDRALATLAAASNQSDYAVLRAEAAGVVTAVAVEPGQVVAAGQAIVTVARTDALDAVIPLPEQLLPSLEQAAVTAVL